MKITATPKVTMPNDVHYIDIQTSFDRIKQGKNKDIIHEIRALQKQINKSQDDEVKDHLKTTKDKLKKELPAMVYTGKFKGRGNDNCTEYNGLIVLDFDHVDVTYTKSELKQRDYIMAVWTSPSGDGVKALAKIDSDSKDDKIHKEF